MLRTITILCLILFAGCATPMAPTGGPPVRTSPQILSTDPAQGTTRFARQEVRLEFNRFMNRASATRALRIEPDLGISHRINWKRKVMVITFDEPLPDSVTVILSLGAELSDVDNNRLGQPFQLAFSTGTAIDSAGVDISTISFDKTRGESGMTVGLFRESALDQTAVYMAESDTSGMVRFRNATSGQYIAVLFDDRNRNRRIDAGERHFVSSERVKADTDTSYSVSTLVYNAKDTIPPSVLGIGLMSTARLRVRFSEPILLNRSSSIEVSQSGRKIPAFWLFTNPEDPTVAYATTLEPTLPGLQYSLKMDGIEDLAKNQLKETLPTFAGSSQQDTTRQRIIRIPESPVVFPQDSILFVYSKPTSDSNVIDSLIVIDGERTIRGWSDVHVENNRVYVFRQGGWRSGQSYQLRMWDPLLQRHLPLSFRTVGESEVGSLEIITEDVWEGQSVMLEIVDQQGETMIQKEGRGPFIIEGLLPGEVAIRVWVDTNSNRRWDGGTILPEMSQSESVYIQRAIPISPRMTTAVRVRPFN